MEAVCQHPFPPPDCPLAFWQPAALVIGHVSKGVFDKIAFLECDLCGARWKPDGTRPE
jgi:hypothetical protein